MSNQLLETIGRFAEQRILVIGEASTDIDLRGSSERVAREAPVPIVQIEQASRVPGRAANAAVNVAELGGRTTFLSVVGDDFEGAALANSLQDHGVDTSLMVRAHGRQTQTVQRVIANDHLLVRFDSGSQDELPRRSEAALIRRLRREYPHHDAILISDYGYSILSDNVLAALAGLQRRYRKPLVVDSKYLDRFRDVGVTAVKPNYGEALRILGITKPAPAGRRAAQLEAYRDKLLDVSGADYALVTLDVEGSLVLSRSNGRPHRTFSRPVANSRAVGAGDTYAATLTLALAAVPDDTAIDASTVAMAAEAAQAAASIVVQKAGTVTCSHRELADYFCSEPKTVSGRRELVERIRHYKSEGRRIVFTNGCFDILHSGHVTYLHQAKAQGDVLVIGLNSDASVMRLKGPERPVNNQDERARILAGLSAVDLIAIFEEDTPINLIKAIRPDVYVKGGDYERGALPETPVVEGLGGQVAIMPFVLERSTTRLINRIRQATGQVTEKMAGKVTGQIGNNVTSGEGNAGTQAYGNV